MTAPSAIEPGIHLVHKAAGQTSFALVQSFMDAIQAAGIRRDKLPVCHGGVLDPFAEGLLLVLAGPATQLFDHLHAVPKEYVARVAFGAETDTGDLLGQLTKTSDPAGLTEARLDEALRAFRGWSEQVPPATSNKRVDGERAYRRAHRGEEVQLPPSRVYLHEARWEELDLPRAATLRLVCRGGFYVRSLARDLARAAGTLGHLTRLERTAIGPWRDGQGGVVQGAALLPWLPSREVTERELGRLRARETIAAAPLTAPAWPLPPGFPGDAGTWRALREGRLAALVDEAGAARVVLRRPI